MESPSGQRVSKFDDELEPHQVGGSEAEEAIGSTLIGRVLVGPEEHRPVIQGSSDRQILGERELDAWTEHACYTARISGPFVAVDDRSNPESQVGCRPSS